MRTDTLARTLSNILLLALAYILAGRLALLLAIPPGYAMAVYPPAGLALGVVLVKGYRLAPGVALGSFLLNLWIGWEAQGALSLAACALPLCVATGAALQALFGAWLIRRWVGYPNALDKEWRIIRFLLLAGPVGCLVNASAGVGALHAFGLVAWQDVPVNWVTWWIGDTLGVLTISPIVLIAWGEPRDIWLRRRLSVGLPLLATLSLVVVAFLFVRHAEQQRQSDQFQQKAQGMAATLQTRLDSYTAMIESTQRLFASSENVTRDEFHSFVAPALLPDASLQVAEWAPLVQAAQRARYEQEHKDAGYPGFAISERGAGGALVDAPTRASYLPVDYLEPYNANASAQGFDLASDEQRRAAIENARDSGVPVASVPVHLVQLAQQDSRIGILLFCAVYQPHMRLNSVAERRLAFRGVVLAVVRLDTLVESLFPAELRRQIELRLFDPGVAGQPLAVFDTMQGEGMQGPANAPPFATTLHIGGRALHLQARPSQLYWQVHKTWSAWWALVSGLCFTSLTGMYLLLVSGNAFGAERLAARRTEELQSSKEELAHNARLLHTVMDSTTSYVHVRDLDGRFLYVNKEYERVFGFDQHAVIGKTIEDVFPPHLARKYRASERAVIESRGPLRTEAIVQYPDGPHTFLVVRSPLIDESGAVMGAVGVGTDITQRKRDEEAIGAVNMQLAATTRLQQAILNGSNFSIIATDTAGLIQVFNSGASRMLGYAPHEMVGLCDPAIVHDAGEMAAYARRLSVELGHAVAPGFEALAARARHGGADEHPWTYVRKDGSRLPVMLSMTGLFDEAGKATGFLCIAYDLTERNKVENMKSEFISTVSHELRTPLTSIRGALGLMAAGAVGTIPESAMSLLGIAASNCERLVRMINDILDVEKIESGQMRFQIVVQPLRPVIEYAIAATSTYASEHQVRFVLEGEEDGAEVAVDGDRLSQVMINLLSNAAKFSPAGATVTVRLQTLGQSVRVSVIDQGSGIPPQFHARIFQKFAQADSSDTRSKGGTGLGLSITKAIVEQLGGRIDFRSEPGAGSVFYFDLPRVGAPAAAH
ncbi:MAG: CHASE domain-containing protein [Pseudomonadota bacterium]